MFLGVKIKQIFPARARKLSGRSGKEGDLLIFLFIIKLFYFI